MYNVSEFSFRGETFSSRFHETMMLVYMQRAATATGFVVTKSLSQGARVSWAGLGEVCLSLIWSRHLGSTSLMKNTSGIKTLRQHSWLWVASCLLLSASCWRSKFYIAGLNWASRELLIKLFDTWRRKCPFLYVAIHYFCQHLVLVHRYKSQVALFFPFLSFLPSNVSMPLRKTRPRGGKELLILGIWSLFFI